MRSIKELLQVMLDNQELFYYGLCHWKMELYLQDKISFEEDIIFENYIEENRPSKFSSFNAFRNSENNFYWDKGDIKPRIKWLKKHIKLNS